MLMKPTFTVLPPHFPMCINSTVLSVTSADNIRKMKHTYASRRLPVDLFRDDLLRSILDVPGMWSHCGLRISILHC